MRSTTTKKPSSEGLGSGTPDVPIPGMHRIPERPHRREVLKPPGTHAVRRNPLVAVRAPPELPVVVRRPALPLLREDDDAGGKRPPLGVDGAVKLLGFLLGEEPFVARATGNGGSHWFLGVSFSAEGTMGKKPSAEGKGVSTGYSRTDGGDWRRASRGHRPHRGRVPRASPVDWLGRPRSCRGRSRSRS